VTSPTPQSERPRAARAAATFPVQLSTRAEGAADAPPARLRDISEIGLACTSQAPITEMTMVALDFALPGASERHHVKGAIVRCEPMAGAAKAGKGAPKEWDVAIYFTEITPVTRAALRGYVGKGKKV
jgi:hypothetical protein